MTDGRIDAWAVRLLELAAEAGRIQDLAAGRGEARSIGEEIDLAGGFELMRTVAHRTRDMGKDRGQPFALGYVERWWNGIGDWRS
jgi:hypothetical protein